MTAKRLTWTFRCAVNLIDDSFCLFGCTGARPLESRQFTVLLTKPELQILSSSLPVDGGSPIAGYLAAVSPDFTWETARHGYRTYINPALYVPFYDCACVRVLLSHVSSHLVSDKKNDA